MAKEIPFNKLQAKYSGKILALSADRSEIFAVSESFEEILKIVKSKKLKTSQVIFSGPIPDPKTPNV